MTKPGFTDSGSHAADRARIRDASDLAEQLTKGKMLSPESKARARDAFVDLLWKDSPGAEKTARVGIVVLYHRTTDSSDEAELFGEIVAAGKRGVKTFDEVVRSRPPRLLSPTEVDMLRHSLDKSPEERLEILTRLLSDQADKQRTPSKKSKDLGHVDLAEPPRSRSERLGEATPTDGGPDPEAEAEAVLSDHSRSEQDRLEYARQVGDPALRALTRMLNDGDVVDRDFAVHALHLLAKNPSAAKKVFDAARKLELEAPALRDTVEPIRRHAENTLTGRGELGRLSHHNRAAQLRDGILSRALSMCDSPSILRASAGQEALAIPLVLRQLARLRATQ